MATRPSFLIDTNVFIPAEPVGTEGVEPLSPAIAELEQALGETVHVACPWGTRWARIYVERSECEMNDELAEWAVGKMLVMMATMQPILDGLTIE